MGQTMTTCCCSCCCCCCCWRDAKDDAAQFLQDKAQPGGSYMPPSEASVHPGSLALQQKQSSLPFGQQFGMAVASGTDGYPPHFFKRLDKHLKAKRLRAHDAFKSFDCDQDKLLTADELLTGLSNIAFQISKKEERLLREWLVQVADGALSFKAFSLALKQRAAMASPSRVSIIKGARSSAS